MLLQKYIRVYVNNKNKSINNPLLIHKTYNKNKYINKQINN
jgi:hypothetical protein